MTFLYVLLRLCSSMLLFDVKYIHSFKARDEKLDIEFNQLYLECANILGDRVSAGRLCGRGKNDVCLYIVSYRKGCESSGCLIWGGFPEDACRWWLLCCWRSCKTFVMGKCRNYKKKRCIRLRPLLGNSTESFINEFNFFSEYYL